MLVFFFFSSRRRHTRWTGDWSSDVCSSDLVERAVEPLDRESRVREPSGISLPCSRLRLPALGMHYLPEPKQEHGAVAKTAVLLVNLGTPDAPTPQAVRRYLRQFLSDPRVIEIPRALWLPILHGFVLNTRPRKSARKYASIWSSEGSPLRVHTEKQARLLGGHFESRISMPLTVEFAMRYGEPSIGGTLVRLKAAGCERVLVLPMYPQY